MGGSWRVIQRARGLLFGFPRIFKIIFVYSVYIFIYWLFGNMDNSERIVKHDEEYDSIRGDDHKDDYDETGESSIMAGRNPFALIDMQTFRQKCEEAFQKLEYLTDDDMEDEEDLPNLQFYRNNKRFTPDGVFIEDFHNDWFRDYDRLEAVHTYIQWLFPIQEKGMNYESHMLSLKEIKHFHEDKKIKERLLQSYKLMLDFYGIKLVDDKTGKVTHAENWSDRFDNLNRNPHNNLRITRILKCLGLLGFGHYQAPLVHFFLKETLVHGTLPRVKQSALDYFIFAVLDKSKRKELIRFADHLKPETEFVWCPSNKLPEGQKLANYRNNDRPNKGTSIDSNSQSDQKDLMDSRVQSKDEIESDTRKDASNDKSLSSEKDENVSVVCQESDTADANKDTGASSWVDIQHDPHVASVQGDESKAGNNEISNTEQKATENLDANGNDNAAFAEQSKDPLKNLEILNESTNKKAKTELKNKNVANKTPLSGISGSEQQQDQEKSKEGTQQRDCESPEDRVATGSSMDHEGNSARYDAETSADMNRYKFTESDENIVRNPHGESEHQNLDDELDTSRKEENEKIEDPVNRGTSTEENPEDRLTDACGRNDVTSNNDENSASEDVKDGDITESEPTTARRSGVNSSQGILGNDSQTEEGKKVKND